jgi:hypothetical protein
MELNDENPSKKKFRIFYTKKFSKNLKKIELNFFKKKN